jgi:RNA polymerase sigma factor (sigma-70 family)
MFRIPPEIKDIVERPGGSWSQKEKNKVLSFLYKNKKRICDFAMQHGGCSQLADAEDMLEEYFLIRWEFLIRHFDPSKGSFIGFFREDFKRFLRKKLKRRVMDEHVSEEALEERKIPGWRVIGAGSPIASPQKGAARKILMEDLWECSYRIKNPKQRRAFQILLEHDFKIPMKEIATAMRAKESSIRPWLYRARRIVRDCLIEKGWGKEGQWRTLLK